MCVDPLSLSAIAIGGSAITGAIGSYVQGQSEANADRSNAQAQLTAGYAKENLQRDQDRRAMATQLATLSARGAALDTGAPLALMQTSARNAELNDLTIRANAQSGADAENYKASATEAAMPFSIAGQLLGGASKFGQLKTLGAL